MVEDHDDLMPVFRAQVTAAAAAAAVESRRRRRSNRSVKQWGDDGG